MIGNIGSQSAGIDRHFWYTMGGDEYEVTSWLGGYVRHGQKEQVTMAIIAACRKARSPYPICGSVPNVSGQRQTKCHDFPDIEPDDPETPVLEDVEPLDNDPPVETVDCADSPRQETVPYLVWGAMKENAAISDMVRELQPHDRDDLRQDMAMKYWRKAVRQELRGDRIQGLTKWLTADVRQWIGERTDIATSEPLTKQQIDDAKGDTLLLQRSASEESRLEKLEHELRIEQSRFAAEIEAAKRAKQPKQLLALKW